MNEYIFLYFLGFFAILFAVFQDIRTREIANWLTFSLIAFVLAYRAFYSIYFSDFMFFLYGICGILLFVCLGYLFYYSRIFAGGDAKLLFGIGGIFPYSSWIDYFYYGVGFVSLLFISGIIYTLIYSAFLVSRNYSFFKKCFSNEIHSKRYLFILSFIFSLLIVYSNLEFMFIIFSIFIFLTPLLFAYVRAIEKSCMIQFVSVDKLTEGDWLERDVIVNGKIIRKNFSGLTFKEILILRKAKKKVWIKTGVPFAPAFLIAFILFFLFLRYSSWKFF